MNTLWVVGEPGCTGLGAAETLPRGDSMTPLGCRHNEPIMMMVIFHDDAL